ncbi:hypothetical protein C2S52_017374 [Perilla frutescens var. hirtella]|nr:hypothetical protein C2S52_017374 [Perilla frutescens var. hirtella]
MRAQVKFYLGGGVLLLREQLSSVGRLPEGRRHRCRGWPESPSSCRRRVAASDVSFRINFGVVAIAHFRDTKSYSRHRISYAQLITQLAVKSKLLDLSTTDLVALSIEYFDINCLKRIQDVIDDEDGNPVFFVSMTDPLSILFSSAGIARKPLTGMAQQGESPVAAITEKMNAIENAMFQSDVCLVRIEKALKAYFNHVGFTYLMSASK